MKSVLSLAALLALAVGFLSISDQAEARCWKRCRLFVPAPVVVPVVPVAPVPQVIAVPAPNPMPAYEPVPCAGCYTSYAYPAYTGAYAYGAYPYMGGYWRRDCWYDGFGRRFCN